MPAVVVTILRVVDEDFPSWVEGQLTDRFGRDWRIVEKLPVVDKTSSDAARYPRSGVISCSIIRSGCDEQGRAFCEIDTANPWGIASVEGNTRFEVFVDQLTD